MTISFVDVASDTDNAGVGPAVVLPATILAGDQLVAFVATNSESGYSYVTPDGWQQLSFHRGGGASGDGGSTTGAIFSKVAAGTDAGATVTFFVSPTASGKTTAVVGVYRGTDTTPFIDVYGILGHPLGDDLAVPLPDLTTTKANTTLVVGGAKKPTTALVWTAGAGVTKRGEAADGIGGVLGDATQATAGVTNVPDWTVNVSSDNAQGFMVALYEGDPPPLMAPVFRKWTVNGWYPAP